MKRGRRTWIGARLSARGFTLFELIIVLAIFSIMATIGTTSLLRRLPLMRMNAAARDLFADIQNARIEALKSNRPVTITFVTAKDVGNFTIDQCEAEPPPVPEFHGAFGDDKTRYVITGANYPPGGKEVVMPKDVFICRAAFTGGSKVLTIGSNGRPAGTNFLGGTVYLRARNDASVIHADPALAGVGTQVGGWDEFFAGKRVIISRLGNIRIP